MAVTSLSPVWRTLTVRRSHLWRAAHRAVSPIVWNATDDLIRADFRALHDEGPVEESSW